VDWREFVASLVDSAAWPAAAVATVLLLRSRMGDLLSSSPLRRLKVGPGGAELEWAQVAAEVRADVVASPSPKRPSPFEIDGAADPADLDGLAEREPAKAIEIAHALLLGELRAKVAERKPELLEGDPSPFALVKAADREGVISRADAEALRGMLTLRDLTAHRPHTATVDRAIDFIVMARAVLYALSSP
jgi:hypothetical protein